MVLAPFSEIQGRRPVFIVSGLVFVLCQLCTGLTQSYAGMLVVRFFVGVGGSTFSTMVGGVVSDIYHTSDRNKPMALFSGSALFGTGAGPLVCGFIAHNTTWRWIFYMQTIIDGIVVGLIILVFKETRGSVLLSRKAHALNKWYDELEAAGYSSAMLLYEPRGMGSPAAAQRIRWKVKSDEERSSLTKMITISLYRPFHLLFTEPVVFWFSLWVAFSWAILYLTLAAIPLLYQTYHPSFTLATANAIFGFLCAGAILGTILSIYQERLVPRILKSSSSSPDSSTTTPRPTLLTKLFSKYKTPEDRIYFACLESALMPIGLFMFGWSARSDVHWVVPGFAITLATIGIFSIYLSVFNYLADTYHRYASSALAAQSFCRNMLGECYFPWLRVVLSSFALFVPASMLSSVNICI
jgi:MFS family permease